VSRDIELLTVLTSIQRVVSFSDTMCGSAAEVAASYTDSAALRQVLSLAKRGIDLLNLAEEATGPAVALHDPAPQSSVEIESRVKGVPGVKVKVYAHDPHIALTTAQSLFDQAVANYAGAGSEGTP
jgi:hypothetical protein